MYITDSGSPEAFAPFIRKAAPIIQWQVATLTAVVLVSIPFTQVPLKTSHDRVTQDLLSSILAVIFRDSPVTNKHQVIAVRLSQTHRHLDSRWHNILSCRRGLHQCMLKHIRTVIALSLLSSDLLNTPSCRNPQFAQTSTWR